MIKILCVEDNNDNLFMLQRRLTRAGFEVKIAMDGAEGVEWAKTLLDGWEATRRIKAAPETKHIPVVALTAHAMAGDREKALAAGCNDFDTKPVELPRLLGKIRALLREEPAA